VHEVALADLAIFALDRHDPAPGGDVIELVRGVLVRVDESAARELYERLAVRLTPKTPQLSLSLALALSEG
jgi:hypothetical protein